MHDDDDLEDRDDTIVDEHGTTYRDGEACGLDWYRTDGLR